MSCLLGFGFRAVFSPDSAVGTGLGAWWSSAIATPQLWAAAGWMCPKLSWWQLMTRNKKEFFGARGILSWKILNFPCIKASPGAGLRGLTTMLWELSAWIWSLLVSPWLFSLNSDDAKGKKNLIRLLIGMVRCGSESYRIIMVFKKTNYQCLVPFNFNKYLLVRGD